MHLFDIDIPGKVTFRESDTLSAGDKITTFATPFGTVMTQCPYLLLFTLCEYVHIIRSELRFAMTFDSQS